MAAAVVPAVLEWPNVFQFQYKLIQLQLAQAVMVNQHLAQLVVQLQTQVVQVQIQYFQL